MKNQNLIQQLNINQIEKVFKLYLSDYQHINPVSQADCKSHNLEEKHWKTGYWTKQFQWITKFIWRLTAWSVVFLEKGTGISRSCNSPPITWVMCKIILTGQVNAGAIKIVLQHFQQGRPCFRSRIMWDVKLKSIFTFYQRYF